MFSNLVVLYLFLGGCSAGLLVYACAVDLVGGRAGGWLPASVRKSRVGLSGEFLGRCYLVAAGGMALGILCLLVDLGRPDHLTALVVRPSFSVITVGAYSLGCALVCAAALGLVGMLHLAVPNAVVRLLESAGCVFGLVTAGYTGALLAQMSLSVGLWNGVLIPLFLLSSLSAGMAWFGLAERVESGGATRLSRITCAASVGVGLLEALTVVGWLVLCLQQEGPVAIADFFATGEGQGFVICFCMLGLVVPLALEVAQAARPEVLAISLIAPVLTIAGAFCLRYCLVNVPIV